MADERTSLWSRWRDRLLPRVPDFADLLAEQCRHVWRNARDLVDVLDEGPPDGIERLDANEAEAERLRRRNLRRLNRAFSTPFDREDIHRAIEQLDWITVHLNRVPHEMRALEVTADEPMRQLGREVLRGVEALTDGFAALKDTPQAAAGHAEAARKSERRARRLYEHGLASLFQGTDHIQMLKRRELYHHLADGAKRVHSAASILLEIVVKIG